MSRKTRLIRANPLVMLLAIFILTAHGIADVKDDKSKDIKRTGLTIINKDGLLFVEFYIPDEMDKWAQNEYQTRKLLKKCGSYSSACFIENIKGQEDKWKIAKIYSVPDSKSKVLGELMVVVRDSQWLGFGIDFIEVTKNKRKKWINDVGDWGYGIDHYVIDSKGRPPKHDTSSKGKWVLLPENPFPKGAWLNVEEVDGRVYSLKNRLVAFPSIIALNLTASRKEEISDGIYFIKEITDGEVIFRPEIPSDMPCGEDPVDPPKSEIIFYEVSIQDLYIDGHLILSPAYPKGC
jgi:hypothetical protein